MNTNVININEVVDGLNIFKRWNRAALLISILLFVVSLTQTAYCVDGKCEGEGFLALATGWLGTISYGGAAMAWLANPLLWLSWVIPFERRILKLSSAGLAMLFCLSFMYFDEIVKNEAGQYGKITSYAIGYWLWMSSMGFYFIANVVIGRKPRISEKPVKI